LEYGKRQSTSKEAVMVQMTLNISEDLAERLEPLGAWLPTTLELMLVGCKTVAAASVAEILAFLAQDPTPEDVLAYHASERAQSRLQRLLTLNASGLLSEEEQLELDERQQIEHIIIMLKAQLATSTRQGS
jgi:hypothetical protein